MAVAHFVEAKANSQIRMDGLKEFGKFAGIMLLSIAGFVGAGAGVSALADRRLKTANASGAATPAP